MELCQKEDKKSFLSKVADEGNPEATSGKSLRYISISLSSLFLAKAFVLNLALFGHFYTISSSSK